MDEMLDAGRPGEAPEPRRTLAVDRLEALLAALMQDADEVDDRIDPGERLPDARLVGEARADEGDLADIAHRLQHARPLGVAHDRADHGAARGEVLHDVAADEPGGADHG